MSSAFKQFGSLLPSLSQLAINYAGIPTAQAARIPSHIQAEPIPGLSSTNDIYGNKEAFGGLGAHGFPDRIVTKFDAGYAPLGLQQDILNITDPTNTAPGAPRYNTRSLKGAYARLFDMKPNSTNFTTGGEGATSLPSSLPLDVGNRRYQPTLIEQPFLTPQQQRKAAQLYNDKYESQVNVLNWQRHGRVPDDRNPIDASVERDATRNAETYAKQYIDQENANFRSRLAAVRQGVANTNTPYGRVQIIQKYPEFFPAFFRENTSLGLHTIPGLSFLTPPLGAYNAYDLKYANNAQWLNNKTYNKYTDF